ncbi:MAG: tetratricopeptide repeat protein [Pyrinomonadaceae bacterium]
MKTTREHIRSILAIAVLAAAFHAAAGAQMNEICGETGGTVWLNSPFVFGRISLNGFDRGARLPKITVTVLDRQRREYRFTIGRTGNYCFRELDGSGGTVIVDIEGVEVERRSLPSVGPKQFRQDFAVYATQRDNPLAPPGTVSVKYAYSRSEANAELFERADAADEKGETDRAIRLFRELLASDPQDFVAWARLGSLHYQKNDRRAAQTSYLRALKERADFVPAMLNLGQIYLVRKNIRNAIETLKKAVEMEPELARAHQLLGEAYILNKQGTLGVAALNRAIEIDPVGMAQSHLLMARLYDLAGAKRRASREYALFLEKVPEHPDRAKFERYIRANPIPTESGRDR